MTTKEYKEYKGLKKESLRDNMTNTELVLNMLAEVSTTEISKMKTLMVWIKVKMLLNVEVVLQEMPEKI